MTTILHTHHLSIGYSNKTITKDLNLTIESGQMICLIGPNGAGKSTLLRTLAGMQKPLAGSIQIMGDDLDRLKPAERARRLSVVLTHRIEAGIMNGYELVALGRHPYTNWSGRLGQRDEQVIRWAVDAVGAAMLAPRPVGELSDGERQKIMIARALAQEPALMILDEPTAYLDLPRRVEMMHLLRELARTTDRAVLLSTHDLDLALRTADQIWLMPPDGQLQTGVPEDLVLSGAFEAAFQGEGVRFDQTSGSFEMQPDPISTIQLVGDGLPAIWTRRALERAGYRVADGGATAGTQVTISMMDGIVWELIHEQHHTTHRSIQALLAALLADSTI